MPSPPRVEPAALGEASRVGVWHVCQAVQGVAAEAPTPAAEAPEALSWMGLGCFRLSTRAFHKGTAAWLRTQLITRVGTTCNVNISRVVPHVVERHRQKTRPDHLRFTGERASGTCFPLVLSRRLSNKTPPECFRHSAEIFASIVAIHPM